jgi:hypothetical protein
MPIDGQKIKEFFTRSGSPTKEQSVGKGPITAALATAAVAGIGKALKGGKGKKPIRTAIKNVKAKIEAKKDFKAQQKAMKPQTPAAPKFKAPKGSKVTKYVKTYGN